MRRFKHLCYFLRAILFFCGLTISARAAQQYTLINLHDLGSPFTPASRATAINVHGQVAGQATAPNGALHAFYYDSQLHDLGTPTGAAASFGLAINDSGVVVGGSPAGGWYNTDHSTSDFLVPQLGGSAFLEFSSALGINSNSVIVGVCGNLAVTNAFSWAYPGGPLTDLGNIGGGTNFYSGATAINNNGVIVGEAQDASGVYHAFSYNGVMTALPLLAGNTTNNAYAINDATVAVGDSGTNGSGWQPRPVYWSGGSVFAIGPVGTVGTAHGINNHGVIVGGFSANFETDAFVYSNGVLTDLNNLVTAQQLTDAGFDHLATAYAVNDSGWIVGSGSTTNLAPLEAAFILMPVAGPTALSVSTLTLPDGKQGTAYSQMLAATGGTSPYHWTNSVGSIPKGLILTTGGLLSGTPTTNGTFNFTVKVTDAVMATASQALQLIIVGTNQPVLSITNLSAGQRVSNTVFTVKGVTTGSVLRNNVWLQLNGGAWTNPVTANAWTNWSVTLNLLAGTNTLSGYVVDNNGLTSPTNQFSFDCVVTNRLGVRAFGVGTISPNYSNAWLELGRSYSITASPAAGFVASNWIISTNWVGGSPSAGGTVAFTMASNLTLLLNFLDVYPPTNTISSPPANQHETNALVTVTGTAKDNWLVTGVWYQLNQGAWNSAPTTNGWTNWAATVELTTGTNTIATYAEDLGGSFSRTNSVSVVSSNTFRLQLAFTNAAPLKNNGLTFQLLSSPGLAGHVQVSSNLSTWTTFTNFTAANTNVSFRDPAAVNATRRFYRAIIP